MDSATSPGKTCVCNKNFFDQNGVPQNTQTYEVDVEALSSGGFKSKKNFWIYPGDRIEVPERLI